MKTACFRFYEGLNDFLPSGMRDKAFLYRFPENATVKHAIEAIGVPHVEIDIILVNGRLVDFSYMLHENDDVSVYPTLKESVKGPLQRLKSMPLPETKFIPDSHLGKLAKHLRMLGFDTLFSNSFTDNEIVNIAREEKRIILTRDRDILKYKAVTHGYWIRSDNPANQLKEVLIAFDLAGKVNIFSRCLECNGLLEYVDKKEIDSHLEPLTRKYFFYFRRCTECRRIYWKGSHYEKMKTFIEEILSSTKQLTAQG